MRGVEPINYGISYNLTCCLKELKKSGSEKMNNNCNNYLGDYTLCPILPMNTVDHPASQEVDLDVIKCAKDLGSF